MATVHWPTGISVDWSQGFGGQQDADGCSYINKKFRLLIEPAPTKRSQCEPQGNLGKKNR